MLPTPPPERIPPSRHILTREGNSAPVGLTFHDPLAIFTRSGLVLSRTSLLFP